MRYSPKVIAAFAMLLAWAAARAQPGLKAPPASAVKQAAIRMVVDSFYAAVPQMKGIIVYVEAPAQGLICSRAAGVSDTVSNEALRADQPILIASNTKTYIAAAILRLQEGGQLNIQQSVAELLPRKTTAMLRADGYDPGKIQVRHLLSHSSGIADYVTDAYFDTVNAQRTRRWTRDEQIRLALTKETPLGAPGDTFRYADINYLLLSEIIEQKTGKPFHTAVRELLEFRANGIRHTWFGSLEPRPAKTRETAHQYWSKRHWDSYAFDPSWDLYGGGGIVASMADMGHFYQALFGGRILRDTAVLNLMHTPVMQNDPHRYCLGMRVISMDGHTGYQHGGFWGTDAVYFPELRATIAIAVLEKDQRDVSAAVCRRLRGLLE